MFPHSDIRYEILLNYISFFKNIQYSSTQQPSNNWGTVDTTVQTRMAFTSAFGLTRYSR